MDRNFNPFATMISNKQVHIIQIVNENIPGESLRTINALVNVLMATLILSHKRASNYTTDIQYFSLLMF